MAALEIGGTAAWGHAGEQAFSLLDAPHAIPIILFRHLRLFSIAVQLSPRLRRFPPKPRLLTSEQYYEQGARETKEALDSLRKYCASPDCKQWSVMLKVNDSKRFASFVEGNSHLSDDEVLDYESYAFSMERKRKPTPVANSTTHDLEISEDDSSDDEDL